MDGILGKTKRFRGGGSRIWNLYSDHLGADRPNFQTDGKGGPVTAVIRLSGSAHLGAGQYGWYRGAASSQVEACSFFMAK